MNKIIFNLLILFILLFSNNPSANELLLYADNISYDSNKNIIAKGNAKIIKDGEIITSDLIIYNSQNKSIIIPSEFIYRDSINNYYLGSSGKFDNNINNEGVVLGGNANVIGIFSGTPFKVDNFWERGDFHWDRKLHPSSINVNGGIE